MRLVCPTRLPVSRRVRGWDLEFESGLLQPQTTRTRLIFPPSKFIAPVEPLASGCERTAVLECRHSRFKRRLRAGWRFGVILNPRTNGLIAPFGEPRGFSIRRFGRKCYDAQLYRA